MFDLILFIVSHGATLLLGGALGVMFIGWLATSPRLPW